MTLATTLHPFTQMQITDKGLDHMIGFIDTARKLCELKSHWPWRHSGILTIITQYACANHLKNTAGICGRYGSLVLYRSMEKDH
jgi:hypothetical protein